MNGDDPVAKSDILDAKLAILPLEEIFTRRQVIIGFAIIMTILTVAFTFMYLELRSLTQSSENETQAENACRFEASVDVNTISDELDALTAELFVVAVARPREPGQPQDPEVLRIGNEMDKQVQLLRPALEAREQAVVDCLEE